jgi:hypothetical protein
LLLLLFFSLMHLSLLSHSLLLAGVLQKLLRLCFMLLLLLTHQPLCTLLLVVWLTAAPLLPFRTISLPPLLLLAVHGAACACSCCSSSQRCCLKWAPAHRSPTCSQLPGRATSGRGLVERHIRVTGLGVRCCCNCERWRHTRRRPELPSLTVGTLRKPATTSIQTAGTNSSSWWWWWRPREARPKGPILSLRLRS